MALTDKRAAFVREYLVDLNATQAAVRAGYSKKTAEKIGWQLLQMDEVRAGIDAGKSERAERVQVSADDVLRELLAIAKADISQAFDERGNVLPLGKIPEAVRRAISSVESGEWGAKVKFWDKPRALELIGKHLKLFTDKVEHEVTLERLTDEQLHARYRALLEQGSASATPPPEPIE